MSASMRIGLGAIATLLGVGVVGAVVVVAGFGNDHQRSPNPEVVVTPWVVPSADPIQADEIVRVIPQDAKTALVGPPFLPAAQASDIQPSEEVIGVVINGDARAFPLATLNVHEIVDDVIGGRPIAVTW